MYQQKNNILVCFLSCKKNDNLWEKILNYNINSIIFFGDPEINELFIYKDNILTLKCNDTYDYLPVKIYLMVKAILKIPKFNNITHILKIDDWDTKIGNNITKIKNIKLSDYCGQKLNNAYNGNRNWHFNKCPLDSIWNNKKYEGKYVPWLDGGCGYILSRNAMNIILKENLSISKIYKNHIFEDVMISLILYKNNIYPKVIPKIIIGDK